VLTIPAVVLYVHYTTLHSRMDDDGRFVMLYNTDDLSPLPRRKNQKYVVGNEIAMLFVGLWAGLEPTQLGFAR
jgi:hypothetical protein